MRLYVKSLCLTCSSDWKREGNYFYFPWLNRIDHFPDVDTLRKVYRFRDKLLLTDEEAAQGYKDRPLWPVKGKLAVQLQKSCFEQAGRRNYESLIVTA